MTNEPVRSAALARAVEAIAAHLERIPEFRVSPQDLRAFRAAKDEARVTLAEHAAGMLDRE